MSVTLEVPNEVTQAMRLPPTEAEARLRLELAIGLYTQRLLPLGKAAQLAGLNRWEFDDVLGRRGIPALHKRRMDPPPLRFGAARDGRWRMGVWRTSNIERRTSNIERPMELI